MTFNLGMLVIPLLTCLRFLKKQVIFYLQTVNCITWTINIAEFLLHWAIKRSRCFHFSYLKKTEYRFLKTLFLNILKEIWCSPTLLSVINYIYLNSLLLNQQRSKAKTYPSFPPKGDSTLMSPCSLYPLFNIFLIILDFLRAL